MTAELAPDPLAQVEELIAAWEAWDARPGNEDASSARVAALATVAPLFGLTSIELSRRIEETRRQDPGGSARLAIQTVVDGISW